jgi:putative nucleotidyltransferase with HDIG domain
MRALPAIRASLRNTFRGNPPGAGSSGARPYVLTVVCAGCAILAVCASELWVEHLPLQWWVLVALTLISGSAVLKIPSISANFSISDVFTLTSAVVFGPSAGTVIVAIDSLVISAFLARRGLSLERILFNSAAPPVAMWLSAKVFFLASGFQPLYSHPLGLEVVGPWLLLFAALYFFLNTFAIAVAIALHERVNVVRIWRAHFQNLWLTFIGGALGAAFVVFALQRAAYGMVVLSFPLLLAAILHFAYRNATGRVADRLHHLEELNRLNLSTIEALAHAIDAKDGVTHRHIRRVQSRVAALARRMNIDDDLQLRAIEAAALLHDIGKLAIPEHILNKPGKLTPEEFERIKSHSRVGAEILSEVDFPYPVVPIVRHHHENWDGTGYPDRLKGSAIPIGARILAVVDCFDALTSDRPYRRALSSREALAIIEERRGTMYEPAIVDAFREMCASTPSTEAVSVDDQGETATMPATPAGRLADQATSETGDGVRMAMALGAAMSHDSTGRCPWRALADALCQLPNVDTAAVFVLDETGTRLMPLRVAGRHAQAIERLSIPLGERMIGWVAAVGQPLINGDAMLDLYDAEAKTLKGAVAIPCRGPYGGSAVVALYSTRAQPFSSVHRQLVETAVSLVAFREEPAHVPLRDRRKRRRVDRRSHRIPPAALTS